MRVEVTHLLAYPRERVWNALLDPAVLARVMPGVEKFEQVGPDQFAVAMKLGVPAVRGNYTGSVQIADKQAPASYRLRGEGKGGPGWARGEVLFTLVQEDGGTRVAIPSAKRWLQTMRGARSRTAMAMASWFRGFTTSRVSSGCAAMTVSTT